MKTLLAALLAGLLLSSQCYAEIPDYVYPPEEEEVKEKKEKKPKKQKKPRKKPKKLKKAK